MCVLTFQAKNFSSSNSNTSNNMFVLQHHPQAINNYWYRDGGVAILRCHDDVIDGYMSVHVWT